MPIREFQCRECGHIFEEIVQCEEGQIPCPHCESNKTDKLISAFGGYIGNLGSASTRPKNAGSFRSKKNARK